MWAYSWMVSAIRPHTCPHPISGDAVIANCRALPSHYLERLSLVSRACSQIRCLPFVCLSVGVQGALPSLSHEKLLLVGRASNQTRCLLPVCLPGLQWPWTTGLSHCTHPWEIFFGGWGLKSNQMCTSSPSVGTAVKLVVCMAIVSFPRGRGHWSGAGPCHGCLQDVIKQEPLWRDSCRVGGLEWADLQNAGAGHTVLAR